MSCNSLLLLPHIPTYLEKRFFKCQALQTESCEETFSKPRSTSGSEQVSNVHPKKFKL